MMKRVFRFSLLAVCAGAGVTSSQANVTGFNFENGNLATSVGPGSMHFLNDGANATQNGTIFGTTTALGLPAINGQVANVMKFPSVSGPNNGYHINQGFADNDGPTVGYLDTYTFGIDMLIATAPASGYIGVFNTTEANGNDAEIWLHWGATPGFWRHGAGGNFGNNSLFLNTWSRILFRVENSATLDIFVNGVQVANNVAWDSGDSLYTTTAPGAFGGGDFSIRAMALVITVPAMFPAWPSGMSR